MPNYPTNLILKGVVASIPCVGGVYTHLFPGLTKTLKGNDSVDLGEDGVIPSQSHIVAGVYLCPPLPDKDVSSTDRLTGIPLYPISLTGAVPAVS